MMLFGSQRQRCDIAKSNTSVFLDTVSSLTVHLGLSGHVRRPGPPVVFLHLSPALVPVSALGLLPPLVSLICLPTLVAVNTALVLAVVFASCAFGCVDLSQSFWWVCPPLWASFFVVSFVSEHGWLRCLWLCFGLFAFVFLLFSPQLCWRRWWHTGFLWWFTTGSLLFECVSRSGYWCLSWVGGNGDFDPHVFVALITWLVPPHWLSFCYLPFSVFVTHENHVLCWPFCLGSTLVQLIKWSIFVEQNASVTASLWRDTGNQSKSFVSACLCTCAHCAQIFSGIFFAGLAGWLSMANGTKLSFIQQAVALSYGQDTLHRKCQLD